MSSPRVGAFIFALFSTLLTGCGDNFNHAQYRITPAVAGDRARVSHLLASVAAETGLPAKQAPPALRESFTYYRRPPSRHGAVALSARVDRRGILINLGAGTGPTPPDFARSERLLDQRLPTIFSSRCVKTLASNHDI
jgi:hypothetical protein